MTATSVKTTESLLASQLQQTEAVKSTVDGQQEAATTAEDAAASAERHSLGSEPSSSSNTDEVQSTFSIVLNDAVARIRLSDAPSSVADAAATVASTEDSISVSDTVTIETIDTGSYQSFAESSGNNININSAMNASIQRFNHNMNGSNRDDLPQPGRRHPSIRYSITSSSLDQLREVLDEDEDFSNDFTPTLNTKTGDADDNNNDVTDSRTPPRTPPRYMTRPPSYRVSSAIPQQPQRRRSSIVLPQYDSTWSIQSGVSEVTLPIELAMDAASFDEMEDTPPVPPPAPATTPSSMPWNAVDRWP